MGYAPLDFLNQKDMAGNEFEPDKGYGELLEIAEMEGFFLPPKEREDETIAFVMSNDFLDLSYDGPFRGFNEFVIGKAENVVQILDAHMDVEEAKAYRERIKYAPHVVESDMRDFLIARVIFDKWARNKQVYRLDSTFAEFLGSTERLTVTRSQLEHLPTRCFYLDFEKVEKFLPVTGAFVYVGFKEKTTHVCCYLLNSNMQFFSDYISAELGEEGNSFLKEEDWEGNDALTGGIQYHKILTTILQFFSYLSVKEPDLEESTKATYKPRPASKIKNKFSEVQRFEVGIRIGKTLTNKMKAWKESTGGDESEVVGEKEAKQRKSPRPYIRSAHWQRYHTGKGRVNTEIRWIEPVFCCAGGKEFSSDVVIHKVDITP